MPKTENTTSDGASDFEQPLEHERAVGQHLAARPRHVLDAGKRRQLLGSAHELAELDRLARRDGIAVHHAQRIVDVRHVQLGERAPRAADRVEWPPAPFDQPVDARDGLVDERQRLVELVAGLIDQSQAAERQRRASFSRSL